MFGLALKCSLALLVVALGIGRLVDDWWLCSLLGPMASRCGLLHPGTPLSRHGGVKRKLLRQLVPHRSPYDKGPRSLLIPGARAKSHVRFVGTALLIESQLHHELVISELACWMCDARTIDDNPRCGCTAVVARPHASAWEGASGSPDARLLRDRQDHAADHVALPRACFSWR